LYAGSRMHSTLGKDSNIVLTLKTGITEIHEFRKYQSKFNMDSNFTSTKTNFDR
jgi:hypothetical protein